MVKNSLQCRLTDAIVLYTKSIPEFQIKKKKSELYPTLQYIRAKHARVFIFY
jgi:hypothetical protein